MPHLVDRHWPGDPNLAMEAAIAFVDVLDLLDDFEWELATPTQTEQIRRPSPRPDSG